MAFLNEAGLQYLINQAKNGIIQVQEYTDVTANGTRTKSDSCVFFMKIKKKDNAPWIVSYRITTELNNNENSKQVADVIIGGYEDKLSYYTTSNIIYDNGQRSSDNHSVALFSSHENTNYVGVDISNSYGIPHNIKIEVQLVYGCRIIFKQQCKVLDSIDGLTKIETFNFSKDGYYCSNDNSIIDTLAKVAFTGDYNDLINKPQLLEMDAEGNTLHFFKL